jgi:aryl-alcohol dehydrogenase-like predicted oxidoreductase
MEYTQVGSTGMKISYICLGSMGFRDAEGGFHK